MFRIGDKIVYPMYGAGVIKNIEEKSDNDGTVGQYYVIDIPNGNLTIKVSATKADTLGLRNILSEEIVMDTMKSVAKMPVIASDNWNQRYKDNLVKIKSGNLTDVAEVVRNLLLREKERGLSGAEKKMLNNAKQIVVSEIVYSSNIAKEKAEELLSGILLSK